MRADVDGWLPHVAEGGIIAFHDVVLPDVQTVIAEITDAGRVSVVGQVNGMAWFRVNG